MSRRIIVYSVSDPAGSITYPTKASAIKEARRVVKQYRTAHDDSADLVVVDRITIAGPLNRDLICRLLTHGGYASDVETIWPPDKVTRT